MASEVQIIVSAKDLATQTIQGVTQSLSNAVKATNEFANSVSRMSLKATVAFTGIQMSAKKLLEVGSASVELENVVSQTFGNMSKEINQWANDIAGPMNRSRYQMREFAGMMGAMVVPMMKNRDLAAQMSKDLAELAVDMASFWNVADEETFNAIRSGLIGQIIPLQRFGINMNVASLQAFAFEKGIKKSVQAMSESEKMHLRYQFLLEHTKLQQGDAARNAETYANSLKGLGADMKNTTEGFGSLMQPLGIELVRNLRDAVKWIGNLDDEVKMNIIRWGTFGTALLGSIAVFGLVTKAVASFVNGLMLVGTAIGFVTSPMVIKLALITGGVALMATAWDENWGGIQDKTQAVWRVVAPILQIMHDWIHRAWDWVIKTGGDAWTWITETTWAEKWEDIKSWLTDGWDWAVNTAGDAWKWFTEETALGQKVEELRQKLTNTELWKWTIDIVFPAVIEGGQAIIKAVVEAGGEMYDAIKHGLDTGDWGPFWSVASDVWSKGVLVGITLSSVVGGIGVTLNAITTGLGLATTAGASLGVPGLLGALTVGLQLMEVQTNGLGYEDFGKKLALSLATGIGIGAFTGSPRTGALAFTIMMNLDWQWLKEPIEKAVEPVRQFFGTVPTMEAEYALEYRGATPEERSGIVKELNMPPGEFVNQPTTKDKILRWLGIDLKRHQLEPPKPIGSEYLDELDSLWKSWQTPEIPVKPIPVGIDEFTQYMKDELSTLDLPMDWRFPVSQWGLETGWGKALSAPFNLAGIKGTGPAGSVTQITREVINGQEVMVEAQFAAFNNIQEFIEAYLRLLKSSYAAALEAQTINEFTAGLLNGRDGRRWATDPKYQELVGGTYRSIVVKGYSDGVILPGYGGGDRRPALLEDGEAVVPKEAVKGGRLGVVEWFKKMGAPGFRKGRLPSISIPRISSVSIVEAEDTISGMQTMFADLSRAITSGFVTMFEIIFDVLENVAVKIFGEDTVSALKDTFEKGRERLQDLIDTLYPQPNKAQLDDPDDDGQETVQSRWREWYENFVSVNEAQLEYVTGMSKVLQNFNVNAAKSISNTQDLLDTIANFPTLVDTMQGGFIGLREQISALFSFGEESRLGRLGSLAGRLGAGYVGWNAFSQGVMIDKATQADRSTNWVGGIAGGLAGMDIGGKWTAGIALGSQIIGSIFPGVKKDASDEQLQKRINEYNETLKEWGASFQSDNLAFQKDSGFLGWRNLFGNVKWETIGKDLAEKGAELAERLIRSMESVFEAAGSGLFDVLFSGADLADFSKVIGRQMQQTLMAEILNTATIKEPLQRLSAYIAEAAKDGFSSQEIANIKDMAGDMYSSMEPFRDMAAEIANEFGLAEESARGLTSTMRNAPSGYKVDLTRWHAVQGVPLNGSGGVTPRQWETNTSVRPVQIIINGSVNGVNDLKRTIQDALDEHERKIRSNDLAYSGVMV